MRNLSNVEINTVAGGKEVCGVQVLKDNTPVFDLAKVTQVNGIPLNNNTMATDDELKAVVGYLQKNAMGNKNHIFIGKDSNGKQWTLLSICTSIADSV